MTQAKPTPDQDYLNECFLHNTVTGKLYWRQRPLAHFQDEHGWKSFNASIAGKEAGTMNERGALRLVINGVRYKAARIIYKLYHGVDAYPSVEHINRDKLDNRIENLREACHVMQCNNRSSNNGLPKGVQRADSKPNPFQVNVCGEHIGVYPTLEEAALAAEAAYDYRFSLENLG